MTTNTPMRFRPSRSGKPQGQRGVDGREPVNSDEVFKPQGNGLNIGERIESVYSKPGIDGGRTDQFEPHELEGSFIMLRIRSDGGALNTTQLRTIADISTESGEAFATWAHRASDEELS